MQAVWDILPKTIAVVLQQLPPSWHEQIEEIRV